MFRTDFNHYLQSFQIDGLTSFMKSVSFMGTTYIILFVVVLVISGVNFRKGIILINIVGWTALATISLKAYFDYPRPIAVDPTLESFGGEITSNDYLSLQPTGFFETFSLPLLNSIRQSDLGRNGFPSGHVMLISCLWLGIAFLFKRRLLWVISILLIILTMFSRAYLGVHYLGDVLGGLFFAILLYLLFRYVISKSGILYQRGLSNPSKIILLMPLMLLLFSSYLPGFQAGALIGLNIAYYLIVRNDNHPEISLTLTRRLINALLFLVLYFGLYVGMRLTPLASIGLIPVLTYAVVNFIVLVMFYSIGKKLKLYRSSNNYDS